MIKVAFICLGAYRISNWTKEQNFSRQSVYSIALEQALSLSSIKDTEERELDLYFYIAENTVSNPEKEIIPELRNQFNHPRIKDVLYVNNNDLGSKNKGAGEYIMCRAVLDKHAQELATYDWVIYYTLRQIIVAPLVLQSIFNIEKNGENKKTIIVANPSSLYTDNTIVRPPSGNYCDMIFAMKPEIFARYIDSMLPEELFKKKMSSEKNLYNFIKEEETKTGVLALERKRLGVLRYDYAINKTEIS